MRHISIFLLLSLGVSLAWSQSAQPSTDEDDSLVDFFQNVLDTEKELEEEFKTNYANYKKDKDAKKKAFSDKLNQTATSLKEKVKQKVDEYKELKEQIDEAEKIKEQERLDKWKQLGEQTKEWMDKLKQKKEEADVAKKQKVDEIIAKMRESYEQNKAAEKEEIKQKFEAWKQMQEHMNQQFEEMKAELQKAKEKHDQMKKEKMENFKNMLGELKTLIEAEATKRMQEKAQRKEENRAQLEAIKNEITAKKDEIDDEAQKLWEQYAKYSKDKDSLKNKVKDAMNTAYEQDAGDYLRDKIQDKLDKEAVKQVVNEKFGPKFGLKSPFSSFKAAESNAVGVAPKATILDEITGKSAWQTITWILLALCILLSIALIAMIAYQLKQRSAYQRLSGHDSDERTPIAQPIRLSSEQHPEKMSYQTTSPSHAPGTSAPPYEHQAF
ncbi:hypothetical protein WR25_05462 [Diploscapter pachys]|uniref:Uncharacterized protein n=1 Tax=Diploscapter pachys TaxID=2018661 RepID=A0A2A2KMD2_9BILA|nr:hypothetical protein WR25_05462 [Diploscapter pachys]